MKEKEILDLFTKTGAILDGHFKLSSGLHSVQYLQCARVLQYPEYAEKLCRALAKKLGHCERPKGAKQSLRLLRRCAPRNDNAIDAVIAPALGGIIVAHEMARSLGVKALFTERIDGKMCLRRGFEIKKGSELLVVEDVVTTGLSTKEVIDVVKSHGATVAGVASLVDRSSEKIDFGTPFYSLIKINIPTYSPENCPLCKKNIPLTKPGSRNS